MPNGIKLLARHLPNLPAVIKRALRDPRVDRPGEEGCGIVVVVTASGTEKVLAVVGFRVVHPADRRHVVRPVLRAAG